MGWAIRSVQRCLNITVTPKRLTLQFRDGAAKSPDVHPLDSGYNDVPPLSSHSDTHPGCTTDSHFARRLSRAATRLIKRELRLMIIDCARARHDCGRALYLFPFMLAALLSVACNHKGASDYLTAGDEAMQNTRLAEAESDYQQAAKVAPSDARPHLALGSLYLFEHKPPQAASELMKALELETGNPKAHAMLASAYAAQSELGSAEAQGRAAVALDPVRAEYRMSLGTTLQSEQKLGAAEAEYRTAVGLEPRNAHSHLALAALLNSEPNRHNEAEAEYAQVKALDPSLVPATAVVTATLPGPANTPMASTAPPSSS